MRISLLIIVALSSLGACRKKTEIQSAPAVAKLQLPAKNEACTSGTIVSDTQTKVVFKWNASTNADSYELHLKNLLTSLTTVHPATTPSLQLTIQRGAPFSWFVISKAEKTASTATSEIWKFYNSGPGVQTNAPFPADNLSPGMGQNIATNTTKVTFQWSGSDVDNDIIGYDVYFGLNENPGLLIQNFTSSTLNNVNVNANTVYYWKVITKDSKGNTSESGLFQFKVN